MYHNDSMNIFLLDKEPDKCAEYHCDKHVVKMCLELAQILSTVHRYVDGREIVIIKNNKKITKYVLDDSRDFLLYQATHINHPSVIWTRQSKENYNLVKNIFISLCSEYTYRYNKIHLSYTKLIDILKHSPSKISDKKFVQMTKEFQAMPIQYKNDDPVQAYRDYYNGEKQNIFSWKNRNKPFWLSKKD